MKKISILTSCLCMSVMLHAAPIEQRNLSSATNTAIVPTQQSTQFWELNQQIQQLQNQIRQLRGQIEEQDNQIEQMNKELQNRYTDLDQRLELLNQKIDAQDETEENPDAIDPAPATSTSNTPLTNNSTAPAQPKTQQANQNANSALDEAAYNMAYDAYKQGGAAKAIQPMENFIKNHPNSPYVSHAYYWLGEFNLSLTPPNFNQAKESFEIVAGNYPKSSKAPAALYRLSEIAKNIDKDIPRAREYYLRLIQNYANTREAETARTSLNL